MSIRRTIYHFVALNKDILEGGLEVPRFVRLAEMKTREGVWCNVVRLICGYHVDDADRGV